ncbi:MAG: hypothetical protein H6537_05495 [Bacteroidales bacterium]|mgnify:CR=1 FL=1|nr:hypothetical protein [Bacteroidales bacterium]HPD94633.1 hypothetical protein [Tenuifilaceae bacterium]HRX30494.1 hypothetical protein [Tenuifilaceae bacterium]
MKTFILSTAFTTIFLFSGCVSPKEFASYKFSQNTRLSTVENSIDNLDSKISRLSVELNSLNNTLVRIESQNKQTTLLLDSQIKELQSKIKSTNDVIATLRIEVALLSKELK